MERHQHAMVKKIPIWGRFGYKLLINQRASHNKCDGFGRERFTFLDETISVASSRYQFFPSVNIEQQECCVNFWDFSGFFWTFLYIN